MLFLYLGDSSTFAKSLRVGLNWDAQNSCLTLLHLNLTVLRTAKTLQSFDHSESNRVKAPLRDLANVTEQNRHLHI